MSDGANRPIFVCRRWDLLGARLMALTNTMAMARSFGCEFRFTWPEGPDPYIADPTPLLSPPFLRQFEITEEDLRGRTVLPEREILFRDRTDVRELLAGMDEQVFVQIHDPFDVVRARDDDPTEAARAFVDAFRSIEWSDEAQRLVDFVAGWNADEAISALHVRGGDIVSGRWRHSMYYGKYMPLPYVAYAAEELSRRAGHLLVLSDNAMLLSWLRRRFDSVVTAAEIVPGYALLPVMLRAFADILVMSRCGAVYGPSDSAFSSLAAHVGGRRVKPADRLVPQGDERGVLLSGIRRTESDLAESPFLRPFVARDIDWYLDVFGDAVPLGEQLELARRAAELDPDSICVTARVAHLAALHGHRQEAAAAAASLARMSRVAEDNPDALVESLATQVAVACVALALGGTHEGGPGAPGRQPEPEERRTTMTSALEGLRSSVQLVRETDSYEIDNEALADNLRDLVAMVEWLSGADDAVLTDLARRGSSWDGTAVDMEVFRAPTPGAHYDDTSVFPAVMRIFDRAVIHVSQAVGSLMTPVREDRTAPMRGYVDEVTAGPTGMQWLRGWVAETVAREGRLVGGLALVTWADFAGGAATTFTLPDFDTIVGPTYGGTVGFRMPVPSALARTNDHTDALRVFGVARDGRVCALDGG